MDFLRHGWLSEPVLQRSVSRMTSISYNCGYKNYSGVERKYWFRSVLDSQSRFNLINRVDAIGAVSVGDGGVLLTGIIAEQ